MKATHPNDALSLILELAANAITADRQGDRDSVAELMRSVRAVYESLTGKPLDDEVIRPAMENALESLDRNKL